ncbi:protein transport protein sft2, partial [Ophidiomyces ophidiicola]
MASASFRDSMNSLGWARRAPEASPAANATAPAPMFPSLHALNPFANRAYVQLPEGSAAPLPAPTRREEEEGWFA